LLLKTEFTEIIIWDYKKLLTLSKRFIKSDALIYDNKGFFEENFFLKKNETENFFLNFSNNEILKNLLEKILPFFPVKFFHK